MNFNTKLLLILLITRHFKNGLRWRAINVPVAR